MYSYEIDNKLKQSRFSLTQEELEDIRECSPQLNHICLKEISGVSSRYILGTSDNHNWEVWISNK